MINILLGAPGGGKSYEAVVFHILPALEKGRKVITNLPLVIEEFRLLDPVFPALIELRQEAREIEKQKRTYNPFKDGWRVDKWTEKAVPFSQPDDYGSEWRHAKDGFGPLYVIDECHIPLRRGETNKLVDEWFSLHRHEHADVLLISQSYGKVSKDIIDLVQVVYRVRKNTAFGSSGSYTRKVQDGIRGDVVNTSIRDYKSQFFKLYKSHTKSGAGQELSAQDIKPIWMRWPFIGTAIFALLFIVMVIFSSTRTPSPGIKSAQAGTMNTPASSVLQVPSVQTAQTVLQQPIQPLPAPRAAQSIGDLSATVLAPPAHPFAALELHISGLVESGAYQNYSFSATQNGQHIFYLSSREMQDAGYAIKKISPCSAQVTFKAITFYVVCDAPRIGSASSLPSVGL